MFKGKFCFIIVRIVFSVYWMTTYPSLNNDPELLKIKTKDDEIQDLKYRTEKQDHENILNSLKIDNE